MPLSPPEAANGTGLRFGCYFFVVSAGAVMLLLVSVVLVVVVVLELDSVVDELSVFLLQPTAARATVRIAIMRSNVSFLIT